MPACGREANNKSLSSRVMNKNKSDSCRSHSFFVGLPSLTLPSSSVVLSTPLCARRYFEWKRRPSKLCQGIRAALGRGRPLAQLAPSRWLSPRTYRDPSCTARLHREGSCEQRKGKKENERKKNLWSSIWFDGTFFFFYHLCLTLAHRRGTFLQNMACAAELRPQAPIMKLLTQRIC